MSQRLLIGALSEQCMTSAMAEVRRLGSSCLRSLGAAPEQALRVVGARSMSSDVRHFSHILPYADSLDWRFLTSHPSHHRHSQSCKHLTHTKMFSPQIVTAILALAPAVFAAPAPQVTSFGPDSQVSYAPQSTAGPVYPIVVEENGYTSASFHGPYTGTPTTTGAVPGPTTLAASIDPKPPNPTATYYNSAGVPLNPFPAPYTPAGGLGTNGTLPRYMVNSDFDFESIALGTSKHNYDCWIEHLLTFRQACTKNGSSWIYFTMVLQGSPRRICSLLAWVLNTNPWSNSWQTKKPITQPSWPICLVSERRSSATTITHTTLSVSGSTSCSV